MYSKKVMRRYLLKRKRYNYSNTSYADVERFKKIDKELNGEYTTKISVVSFMLFFLIMLSIHNKSLLLFILLLLPSYICGKLFISNIYIRILYYICKRELRKEIKSGVVKLGNYK